MLPKDKRNNSINEHGMIRTNSSIFENRNFTLKNSIQNNINHSKVEQLTKHFSLFNPRNYLILHNNIKNKGPNVLNHFLRNSNSVNELTNYNKQPNISQNNLPKIKSFICNPMTLNINSHSQRFKNIKKIHISSTYKRNGKNYSLKESSRLFKIDKICKSKGNSILSSPNENKAKSVSKIDSSDSKQNKIKIASKTKEQLLKSAVNFYNDKFTLSSKKKKNQIKIEQDRKSESDNENNNDDIKNLKITVDNTEKIFAHSQPGKDSKGFEKINQDSFIIIENVLDLEGFSLYGVFDGHGSNGHLISQFIQKKVPEYFCNIQNYSCPKKGPLNYSKITHEQIIKRLLMNKYSIIKKFYKQVNTDLSKENIDINFSGSTCTLIIKVFNKLFISHIGDSRAIMIYENKLKIENKSVSNPYYQYEVVQLTKDHKPDLIEEKKRIEKAGGVVSQYEEGGVKNGPLRVWVKGEDYPGIAMSRSIGDKVAQTVGVIHEPDIITKDILEKCKYIVLCSDGVWEFLRNEDVMKIVKPSFLIGDPEEACNELIKKASEKWDKETSRDDITVVIDFVGHSHVKKGKA